MKSLHMRLELVQCCNGLSSCSLRVWIRRERVQMMERQLQNVRRTQNWSESMHEVRSTAIGAQLARFTGTQFTTYQEFAMTLPK
eukprot:3266864-Amphidinium_carterae.1